MRVLVHLNLDYNCIDYNPFPSTNDVVEVPSSKKERYIRIFIFDG